MENELYHYGVLGMRWGVRKDPSRAYSKATNKMRKISNKVSKYAKKSQQMSKRIKKSIDDGELEYYESKKDKYDSKTLKVINKGEHWISSMNKVFDDKRVKSLSLSEYKRGQAAIEQFYRILTANMYKTALAK